MYPLELIQSVRLITDVCLEISPERMCFARRRRGKNGRDDPDCGECRSKAQVLPSCCWSREDSIIWNLHARLLKP